MIENGLEEWESLTREFGEALLDVERTFLDTMDRQAALGRRESIDARNDPVAVYLEAWTRLDAAHRRLLPYLAAFSTREVGAQDRGQLREAAGRRMRAVRAAGR
jgi:hypothetical protein